MTNREQLLTNNKAIETILRNAPPRPAPSTADIVIARNAVRNEWLAVSRRRRLRRHFLSLAAAASFIGVIAVSLVVLRVPSALPESVAAIERSAGSVYLLDEQSVLHKISGVAGLSTGQTLVTGDDAAVAMAWFGGGSLRVDADSRVEFISPDEIFLHDGRVYFDSQPAALRGESGSGATVEFAVRTGEGLVRHVGTQYMAAISTSGMTVSVREGQVQILGNTVEAAATAGQQVRLRGTARPAYANISPHAEIWRWAERITPAVAVDQRSAHEFISWVARQTGLGVAYAGEAAEQLAHATRMSGGSGQLEPRAALTVLLQTTTLEATVRDGTIFVTVR